MQPATSAEVADGHPLGIPVLKVADFGFARILPAAAMAETLCGSPLYMAPEILRYEKYDAKADLWSVGAVLFEMVSGKPPFRANNHVELLRKIEKGDDKIKFPDESPRNVDKDGIESPAPVPVSEDIKGLIRGLLKRQPTNRMDFKDFFDCGVWDGWMVDETEGEGSTSYEVSTSSSALEDSGRLREMVKSSEQAQARIPVTRAQPISTDAAMNPQPAPQPSTRSPSIHRSQPKYYVSEDTSPTSAPPPSSSSRTTPRPISMQERRMSSREKDVSSVEDPQPLTPGTGPGPMTMHARQKTTEGSPLAATPPIMPHRDRTGKDESALAGSDSMLNREYVVVEKGTVEVNKLADGTSICKSTG
jgi:serine/threonine-protein kinase ULK/ATG1